MFWRKSKKAKNNFDSENSSNASLEVLKKCNHYLIIPMSGPRMTLDENNRCQLCGLILSDEDLQKTEAEIKKMRAMIAW